MNRDNIRAFVTTITVAVIISVIFGSTIYSNNLSPNQAWSVLQQQQQQKDKAFAVVGGVHSPEFQFEKNYTNMKNAVKSGINRPGPISLECQK